MPTYTSHPGGDCLLVLRPDGGGIGVSDLLPGRRERPPHAAGSSNSEISGEEVLLDGNREAEGHEFFALGALSVSLDGRCSRTRPTSQVPSGSLLMIKDLATGELLADQIDDTAYGVAWAKNSHLFYTRADEAWRPYVVLRHRLGDRPVATTPRC